MKSSTAQVLAAALLLVGLFAVAAGADYHMWWCKQCVHPPLCILPGDSVTWTNGDTRSRHTVTHISPNPLFDTPRYSYPDSFTYQFNDTGVYDYYCIPHPYMKSVVYVGEEYEHSCDVIIVTEMPRWKAYLHGALMFLVYGAVLPIGANLASNGRISRHRVVQPCGLLGAFIAFWLAYSWVNDIQIPHFSLPHMQLGLVVLILSFVVQPFAVLRKIRWLHIWNGRIILILGMTNVYMGVLIMDAEVTTIHFFARIAVFLWTMGLIYFIQLNQSTALRTVGYSRGRKDGIVEADEAVERESVTSGVSKSTGTEITTLSTWKARVDAARRSSTVSATDTEMHHIAAPPSTITSVAVPQTRKASLPINLHDIEYSDDEGGSGHDGYSSPSTSAPTTPVNVRAPPFPSKSPKDGGSDKYSETEFRSQVESTLSKRRVPTPQLPRERRKGKEYKILRNAARNRIIQESERYAIVQADQRGVIVSWNKGAEVMFGYTSTEISGRSLQVIMPERYRRAHQAGVNKTSESSGGSDTVRHFSKIYRVEGLRKDHSQFPLEIAVSSFTVDGRSHYTAIMHDMSERQVSEALSRDLTVADIVSDVMRRERERTRKLYAVGAALQYTYELASMDCIERSELARIVESSAEESRLQVNGEQVETVVESLMRGAQDPTRLTMAEFIQCLKHFGLTVDSSGSIVEQSMIRKSFDYESRKRSGSAAVRLSERLKFFVTVDVAKKLWVLMFLLANGLAFALRYLDLIDGVPDSYTKSLAVAKSAGSAITLNITLVLLPILRNVTTFLRKFPFLGRLIPFDSAIDFHKLCSYSIAGWSVVHAVAHYFNFDHVATLERVIPNPIPVEPPTVLPPFTVAEQALDTLSGMTGHLLLLTMFVIYIPALMMMRERRQMQKQKQRRNTVANETTTAADIISKGKGKRVTKVTSKHNLFFYTHLMYILLFGLLTLHGFTPRAWKWLIAPLSLFFIERAYRWLNLRNSTVEIFESVGLPSNVVSLRMRRPRGLYFTPGQYIYLQIPGVALHEFHPFTLTSSPHENELSVHIRVAGDWTSDVYETFCNGPKSVLKAPLAVVDGPYGAAMEEAFSFETIVLIGAGIGSTPASSILKYINFRLEHLRGMGENMFLDRTPFKLKRVFFFWINRDMEAFDWFANVIHDVQANDIMNRIQVRLFLTRAKQPKAKSDVSSLVLRMGLHKVLEDTNRDAITQLKHCTEFGRPNFDALFDDVRDQHGDCKSDIGVFFCGPPGLGKVIKGVCRRHTAAHSDVAFVLKKEIF